ncbi:MAG: TPM domain-containing protein [Bacteroidales bacterium]|nr:TPM domain-containing protein [Bacteroidales bacterium]MDD4385907.1 TPM domain-containing protein [Bacteroidales bacterium]
MLQEQFTSAEKKIIVAAIQQAELNTSGEIRVHIESRCKGEVLDRAADVFAKLKMHKTEQRNGVLFYLAASSKQFAVLGDAGINAKVPIDFWEGIKEEMQKYFRNGEFAPGLAKGIEMAGEKLKEFFPYQTDDVNELSDEISFGK